MSSNAVSPALFHPKTQEVKRVQTLPNLTNSMWGEHAIDDFDDYLRRVVPDPIQQFLFTPIAPKQLRIYDPLLGMLEKTLMFLMVFYVAYATASQPSQYSLSEIPEGSVLFDIERGQFNKYRNDNPHDTLPYCNAGQMDYEYLAPKGTGSTMSPNFNTATGKWEVGASAEGSYWNDDKLSCKQLNFAEMVKKTPSVAYVTTFQKETLTQIHDSCVSCSRCKRHGRLPRW
jgi:hypothetical protein